MVCTYIRPAVVATARKDYHLLPRRHNIAKLTETVNGTRMTLDDNPTVLLITKKFSEEAVKKIWVWAEGDDTVVCHSWSHSSQLLSDYYVSTAAVLQLTATI